MDSIAAYLSAARLLFGEHVESPAVARWRRQYWPVAAAAFSGHGRSAVWQPILAQLPVITDARFDNGESVKLSAPVPIPTATLQALRSSLQALCPWRKGPFDLFGQKIDAEWQSHWKWRRVFPHLADLSERRVLDVGCGNAYYAWRMLGAGAKVVVGLDPGVLSVTQFRAVKHFLPQAPVVVLPLESAALDRELNVFDSVFSMGVLYHRRDPIAHLQELRRALRRGGELILETLVIDDSRQDQLIPDGRYAGMRNVWCVPSPRLVLRWMSEAGFSRARCVDVTITTTAEQRRTPWMESNSLADFLDPNTAQSTIEGYPPPTRAVFIANRA